LELTHPLITESTLITVSMVKGQLAIINVLIVVEMIYHIMEKEIGIDVEVYTGK